MICVNFLASRATPKNAKYLFSFQSKDNLLQWLINC